MNTVVSDHGQRQSGKGPFLHERDRQPAHGIGGWLIGRGIFQIVVYSAKGRLVAADIHQAKAAADRRVELVLIVLFGDAVPCLPAMTRRLFPHRRKMRHPLDCIASDLDQPEAA